MNATWAWVVGPGASAASPGPTRQLTAAYGRVVTWRTAGHAYAQFSIDGRHEEAAAIVERETDLWIYRNGTLIFRGRIVSATDDIDPTSHRCQINAVDYRGMLGLVAKVEPPVPTYTAVDQAAIAWDLIADWQARLGGDYGITDGAGATSGILRDETDINAGAPIAEIIDRLAARENGFEWEISPDLELNRWYPQRGTDNNVVLEHGGMVATVATGSGDYGNVGLASGKEVTTPTVAEHPTLATDQRGRWTVARGYPSVTQQATVDAKAAYLADTAVTVERTWRATLAAQRWEGPDHIWIGDTCKLVVNSGRLQVNAPHRVAELQAVLDGHGEERITLGMTGIDAAIPGTVAPTTEPAQFARAVTALRSDVAELQRIGDPAQLLLPAGTDASLTSTGHPFQIGPSDAGNLIADINEIMARNNGAPSLLALNNDGGRVTVNAKNAAIYEEADNVTPTATGITLGTDGVHTQSWTYVGGPFVGDRGIMQIHGRIFLGPGGALTASPNIDLPAGYNFANLFLDPRGHISLINSGVAHFLGISMLLDANTYRFFGNYIGAVSQPTTISTVDATQPHTHGNGDYLDYSVNARVIKV